MDVTQRDSRPSHRSTDRGPGGSSPPFLVIAVTFASALAAGAAGHVISGNLGWGAAVLVAIVGGAAALLSIKGPNYEEEWALRRQVVELEGERRTQGAALAELERVRRQIEAATSTLREGKDPMIEIAELRVGPLHDLLEASRAAGSAGPVVSRIALDEAELVGASDDRLPQPWPAGADDPPAFDPRVRADALRGIDSLIEGLEDLLHRLDRADSSDSVEATDTTPTPAQLVDAVVHTAADGIEDLAAGLMRASELASVAEKVTNRATLLALNAALEATRSGSEAFAAIAEETRQLAEFAREATDTISRLSSEIEYKVGETITAIHSTSVDAKSAVAALSGTTRVPAPVASAHRASIAALLARAREVRRRLTEKSSGHSSDEPPSGPGDSTEGDTAEVAPLTSLVAEHEFGIQRTPEIGFGPEAESMSMIEVPAHIDVASDLAPEPESRTAPGELPPEHMLLLERLKPAPGYPS